MNVLQFTLAGEMQMEGALFSAVNEALLILPKISNETCRTLPISTTSRVGEETAARSCIAPRFARTAN